MGGNGCRLWRVACVVAVMLVCVTGSVGTAEPAIVIEQGSLAREQGVILGRDLA